MRFVLERGVLLVEIASSLTGCHGGSMRNVSLLSGRQFSASSNVLRTSRLGVSLGERFDWLGPRWGFASSGDECRRWLSGGRPGGIRRRRPYQKKKIVESPTSGLILDEEINVSNGLIRLIDKDGTNRGIVSLRSAMQSARAENLNIVQMTEPSVDKKTGRELPPVCKVLDAAKYAYDQKKHAAAQQSKQSKNLSVKEVKFGTSVEGNDMVFKAKKCEEFLSKGATVKVTVVYRRSRVIKPAEREAKAFEILRFLNENLGSCARELTAQRKVLLGSVRTVFVPEVGSGSSSRSAKSALKVENIPTDEEIADTVFANDDFEDVPPVDEPLVEPKLHSVNVPKREMSTRLLKQALE